ncbi:MAG: response regulator [Treponema sp.]|jgi:two-component system response regulator YesN|nr:response regulator [Treponema sp.]
MYKLFLADDEHIIVRGLKKLLDWHSLHIEIVGEATNGRDAEEAILRLKPDLVILDIRMPLRTGLDILHAIKKEKLETKAIFISAHKDFNYAREALELGALNYLIKPINTEKLASSVEDALRQIDAQAEAREAMDKVFRMEKDTLVSKRGYEKEIIPEFIKRQNNRQIRDILLFMDSHYAENITLKKIARRAYLNPFYFSVYFKKNSGACFKDCLTRIRMEHALSILKREDIKTWELAEKVGFQDPRYFSALFKKIYGKTPMKYKKGLK